MSDHEERAADAREVLAHRAACEAFLEKFKEVMGDHPVRSLAKSSHIHTSGMIDTITHEVVVMKVEVTFSEKMSKKTFDFLMAKSAAQKGAAK